MTPEQLKVLAGRIDPYDFTTSEMSPSGVILVTWSDGTGTLLGPDGRFWPELNCPPRLEYLRLEAVRLLEEYYQGFTVDYEVLDRFKRARIQAEKSLIWFNPPMIFR